MYNEEGGLFSDDNIKLITIDKVRKKRISVKLVDEDGEEINFKNTVQTLSNYVADKYTSIEGATEDNAILNQIAPLVSQALLASLPKAIGDYQAFIMLSLEQMRFGLIHVMILAFTLLKYVQRENIKIVTIEEDVTDEEIAESDKLGKMTSAATAGALYGLSPSEIVKDLIDSGEVDMDDIKKLVGAKDIDFYGDDEEFN